MRSDIQSLPDDEGEKYFSQARPGLPSPRPPSLPSLPSLLAIPNLSPSQTDQHDGEGVHTNNHDTEQEAPPRTPRASQNRAAFGKWKSKAVSEFPAAHTPLPPRITAEEVCRSYPNHVTDYTILTLMREGKGAKAIDALIPAPLGKKKATQSHSKIQLRISTIREAFPDEIFPITSTKRKQRHSKVQQDGMMSSDDESVAPIPAHSSTSPVGVAARSSAAQVPLNRHNGGVWKSIEDEESVKISGTEWALDPGILAYPERKPSQTEISSTRTEVLGVPASTTTSSVWRASHLVQVRLVEERMRQEHQKHQRLLFEVCFKNQALSPSDMATTVRADAAANYDAVSHDLQARCCSTFEKVVLPNGQLEHSISYLRRSITRCFERLPEFWGRIDTACPRDQIDNHFELAILQETLHRVRNWTRYWESRLELQRQIHAHEKLHKIANRDMGSSSTPHPPVHRLPLSPVKYGSSSPSDPISPAKEVILNSQTSSADGPIVVLTGGPRHDAAALIAGTSQERNDLEPPNLSHGSFWDNQPAYDHFSPKSLPLEGPAVWNRMPATVTLAQVQLRQIDQEAGNVNVPIRSILGPVFAVKDDIMTNALRSRARARKLEFGAFMEETGESVDNESRATDLLTVSGRTDPIVPAPTLANHPGLPPSALSALSNDLFILHSWERETRCRFGAAAEAKLAEHRDRLGEIGEDEMGKYVWLGLQRAAIEKG